MKMLFAGLACILFAGGLQAQELVSGGGASLEGGSAWSIGEITAGEAGNTPILTQGLHQPLYQLVPVEDIESLPGVKAWPNPATDFVNVSCPGSFTAELIGLDGRIATQASGQEQLKIGIAQGAQAGSLLVVKQGGRKRTFTITKK